MGIASGDQVRVRRIPGGTAGRAQPSVRAFQKTANFPETEAGTFGASRGSIPAAYFRYTVSVRLLAVPLKDGISEVRRSSFSWESVTPPDTEGDADPASLEVQQENMGKTRKQKQMNKMMMAVGAVALAGMVVGCTTMTPEERRAANEKEYARLAALPPATPVMSPNRDIAACARLSCDLFNEVHPLMKAYVDSVENCREYTGYMNDIQCVKEIEGLSEAEATKKVTDNVIAADANLPEAQKNWPKIVKGIQAANVLDPKKQLIQIAALVLRNTEIVNSVTKLPDAFKEGSFKDKLDRAAECAAISAQLADTLKCLTYLGDQYTRVIEADNYTK